MKYILIICLMLVPAKLKNHTLRIVDQHKEFHQIAIDKDLKCLARNIYFESKGESLKGKLGVAQVTINRMDADGFPSNICDVVYERNKKRCQFSWTCSKKYSTIRNHKSYEDSLHIAHLALNNNIRLPELENSLYFHATYIKPRWKMKSIIRIGNHIFY